MKTTKGIAAVLFTAVTIIPAAFAGLQDQNNNTGGMISEREPDPAGVVVQEEKNITSARVYPTAVTTGEITLELKSKSREDVQITIIDLTGRVVMNETISGFNGSLSKTIALLVPGCSTYFVKVTQGKEVWYDRFVTYSSC
jgi:hypothetical protein